MKKILIIIYWLAFLTLKAWSQGSFFYYQDNQQNGIFSFVKEINGYYYLAGSIGDKSSNNGAFIVKIGPYGNIINQYIDIDTAMFQDAFAFIKSNDTTLRLFINDFGYKPSRLLINELDLNLNFRSRKEIIIKDSTAIAMRDVIIDENGDYVIIGGLYGSPLYGNNYHGQFILKLSPNLDSLNYHEQYNRYFLNIIENKFTDQYYIGGDTYDFDVFDRNLNFVKLLRVDTFVLTIRSHIFVDTNKIALIGYMPLFNNPYQFNIVIKYVDTLGNDYKRVEVYAVDTISTPGFGKMISQTKDSSFIYFVWKKNDNILSYCNGGEPGYVGIGKFDKNLNKKWVKYYGNDSSDFIPIHQITTSDGGVLVAGYMNHCEINDPIAHYFILKVDSAGEYTFMREFTLPQPAVKIYPNPSQDYVSFDMPFPSGMLKWLIIYDQSGRAVKIISGNDIGKKIDIQELNCGVYLLQLTDKNDRTYTGKFVKE